MANNIIDIFIPDLINSQNECKWTTLSPPQRDEPHYKANTGSYIAVLVTGGLRSADLDTMSEM